MRIRAIRAYARRLSGCPTITDYQIVEVCRKAGLFPMHHLNFPVVRSGMLLEELNETHLYRVERWLSMQVFQAGFDSYFAERGMNPL